MLVQGSRRNAARQDQDLIKRLMITGSKGPVMLGTIAQVNIESGPSQIDRFNRLRNINFNIQIFNHNINECVKREVDINIFILLSGVHEKVKTWKCLQCPAAFCQKFQLRSRWALCPIFSWASGVSHQLLLEPEHRPPSDQAYRHLQGDRPGCHREE